MANESEGGDLLHNAVEGGLVKDDGMLRLVLDLSLGPLLLLRGFAAAGRRGSSLSFGLKRRRISIQSKMLSERYPSHPPLTATKLQHLATSMGSATGILLFCQKL